MTFDPLAGDPVRADDWDEFVGQNNLKERLDHHIYAAMKDGRAPGHILLKAGPGFGKTTLARIIARRMDVPFEILTMPIKLGDLVKLLIVNQFDGVLLLDEFHRASTAEQEDLLTLIESNYLQFRGEKFQTGFLTVIAATTEPKKIIKPLRDRFPFVPDIDAYSDQDLAEIFRRMAQKLGVPVLDEDARILGVAAAGTPRAARRFALAARDLYIVSGNAPTAKEVLDHLRIDKYGLSVDHWKYLEALQRLGSQAGIKPLSSYLNESEDVVEELERLLLEQDLIEYTGRGRALKTRGFERIRRKEDSDDETVSPIVES